MSVLIKGMEMPMSCEVCRLRFNCAESIRLSKRPIDCPLVEVPTPHGKLIDREKLAMHMSKAHKEWREHYELHQSVVPTVDDFIMVSCFPAVIEAEEGE